MQQHIDPTEEALVAALAAVHTQECGQAPTDEEIAAMLAAASMHQSGQAPTDEEIAALTVAVLAYEAETLAAQRTQKSLEIVVDGQRYARYPVRTHIITDADKLSDIFTTYLKPLAQPGDILFISEKVVACTQSRAIPMKDIHPRPLAVFLSKFVTKTPYGIGLGIPETMEMALRECGTPQILFAAFISVIGKLLGKRGWFYHIAGDKARAIDGPCDYTIPPYNTYVVLGPSDPDQAARIGAEAAGHPVAVVDINDLGGNILGTSDPGMDRELLVRILADNPLGQGSEQTPCGIIRKIH